MSHKVIVKLWMKDGQMWVQEATYHFIENQTHRGEGGWLLERVQYHEPRAVGSDA